MRENHIVKIIEIDQFDAQFKSDSNLVTVASDYPDANDVKYRVQIPMFMHVCDYHHHVFSIMFFYKMAKSFWPPKYVGS